MPPLILPCMETKLIGLSSMRRVKETAFFQYEKKNIHTLAVRVGDNCPKRTDNELLQ